MVVAEMRNEMSLSEMERNDPSPAEMDGWLGSDWLSPAFGVPCLALLKNCFGLCCFLCISPKHEFIINLFKTIVKKKF